MGCALAVHAQGLLSTLLSHALCVVPRNEKHTPQHKHRAHGDDSPRKGRFVKVVTPRKVLEVEEGAAAQGDGADEKGGRLELVEHINSVRLEVRVHGQEHQGDQADREDLNGNIVLGNVSPWSFSQFNCVARMNFYQRYYIGGLVPVGCMFLAALIVFLRWVFRRVVPGVSLWDIFIMTCQMLWFLTYTMVNAMVLNVFKCRQLDDDLWVLADEVSFVPHTKEHKRAVMFGFVFVGLYTFGPRPRPS